MMKTIFKYQLGNHGVSHVDMPADATILKVDAQNNVLCIWALVNTDNKIEQRVFDVFITGEGIDTIAQNRLFIGTVLLSGGDYVVHVFEIVHK